MTTRKSSFSRTITRTISDDGKTRTETVTIDGDEMPDDFDMGSMDDMMASLDEMKREMRGLRGTATRSKRPAQKQQQPKTAAEITRGDGQNAPGDNVSREVYFEDEDERSPSDTPAAKPEQDTAAPAPPPRKRKTRRRRTRRMDPMAETMAMLDEAGVETGRQGQNRRRVLPPDEEYQQSGMIRGISKAMGWLIKLVLLVFLLGLTWLFLADDYPHLQPETWGKLLQDSADTLNKAHETLTGDQPLP